MLDAVRFLSVVLTAIAMAAGLFVSLVLSLLVGGGEGGPPGSTA